MGISKVIHREEDTQADLWEPPKFDDDQDGQQPVLVQTIEAPDAPKAPTADEIEDIQKQAYQEAYNKGYQEGLTKGQQVGQASGYDEGKQLGLVQGLEEGQAYVTEQATHLVYALNALAEPLNELDDEVERQMTQLAVTMARLLVRRELRTDPGQIVYAVRQAVEVLPIGSREIRVHLHPEDARLVREALALSEDHEDERRWKIVEDPVLTRGGCNIESKNSRVDATIETRLSGIIAQCLGGDRESDRF